MFQFIAPVPFAICMFIGMLICLEIGRRIGQRSLSKGPNETVPGAAALQGAVFSLFGLLVGFTFSGAPARLDIARHLSQTEANAISTAYLRLDLLGPDAQPAIRQLFRNYVDERVSAFKKLPDIPAAEAGLARANSLQATIWTQTLAAAHAPGHDPDALKLLVPSLNEMFDDAASRTTNSMMHPPPAIFGLLFLLSQVCSLLAGYAMAGSKRRVWLYIAAFTLVYVMSVFVTLEIEYPRLGRLSALETKFDQVLVDVRATMN